MTNAVLFEEGNRDSTEFVRVGETNYQFLNRSDRPGTPIIRSHLNSWFSLLPENTKSNFLARFKVENNFAGAFYELFLLGLFTSMDFIVEVEPLTQENKRIPDFLLHKDQSQIIVEATTNKYSFSEEVSHFNIRKQIIEELNQLDLKNIRLLINKLVVYVDSKPSIKTLKRRLQDHCNNIDLQRFTDFGLPTTEGYEFTYDEEQKFVFSTSFYLDKSGRGQLGRTVFSDSYDIGKDETAIKLASSIEEKKTRYGKMHHPYIICVNFPKTIPNPNDLFSMLFSSDLGIKSEANRRSGFAFKDSPKNKSLSALIVSFVVPYNMGNPQFWLFKNPIADLPVNNDQFPIDTYEFKEGKICFNPAQICFSELLDIPESLPPDEP